MMCLTCGKVQLNRSLIYILAAQLRGAHKFSLLSSCFAYSLVLTASVFRVSHGGDVYARRWCLSIGARFQYLLLSHTIIICMPSARNNVCFFSSCWFTKVVKQCEDSQEVKRHSVKQTLGYLYTFHNLPIIEYKYVYWLYTVYSLAVAWNSVEPYAT